MGKKLGTVFAPMILGTLGATAGAGVGIIAMLVIYSVRPQQFEKEGPIAFTASSVVGAAAGIYYGYNNSSSFSL
jgi:hypothetical protein